jgi:hypothetical protein
VAPGGALTKLLAEPVRPVAVAQVATKLKQAVGITIFFMTVIFAMNAFAFAMVVYQGRRPIYPHMAFLADSGLLHDRVRLDKSFPMGPCSTSGDQNSLRYDLGPHHCDCHVSTQ